MKKVNSRYVSRLGLSLTTQKLKKKKKRKNIQSDEKLKLLL